MKKNKTLYSVNFNIFLVVGVIAIWFITHNGWAIFWVIVAALRKETK